MPHYRASFAIFLRVICFLEEMGDRSPSAPSIRGRRRGFIPPDRYLLRSFFSSICFARGGGPVVYPGGATTRQCHKRQDMACSPVSILARGRDRTRQGRTRRDNERKDKSSKIPHCPPRSPDNSEDIDGQSRHISPRSKNHRRFRRNIVYGMSVRNGSH